MNKLIEEKLKSERMMELDRGCQEAAQLQELRDVRNFQAASAQPLGRGTPIVSWPDT